MKRNKEHNTKYSPEFKISVIMDMRDNHLGYCGTMREDFYFLKNVRVLLRILSACPKTVDGDMV